MTHMGHCTLQPMKKPRGTGSVSPMGFPGFCKCRATGHAPSRGVSIDLFRTSPPLQFEEACRDPTPKAHGPTVQESVVLMPLRNIYERRP